MASELPQGAPFMLPFEGTWPQLGGKPELCGAGASILGRVTIGAGARLGPGAVIRADGHFVRIGEDFRLGAISTVHIAHELHPAIIGDRVSVGRDAVVHACTVGDDCVFEDGVVVLDGAVVEGGVLIEARSTVFPRSTLTRGLVYSGSPAKPVREVAPRELAERAARLADAMAESRSGVGDEAGEAGPFPAGVFVARTARLLGAVALGAGASVLFGCWLDAGQGAIKVGANANIQDNSRIDATRGEVVIGGETTIGHNVEMQACRIGADALIGIGSALAPGTIVEDDVLLAAGSLTAEGQWLEGGWLWGGRPARPISPLNEARRTAMREIIGQYRAYGAAYRLAQDRPAAQGGSNGTSAIAHRHPDR